MINPKILSWYLFKVYSGHFFFISLVLTSILVLSNVFDTLQKFKATNLPTQFFWQLVLYKAPYLLSEIAPLISFISMLFFLRALTRHNEMIIILCNGVPIWRVLMVPVLATLMFGIVIITIVGPIGAYGLNKYENLEAKLLKKKQNGVLVAPTGILFFEEYEDNNRIIQARTIDLAGSELKNITFLFITNHHHFLKRIDAERAILNNGQFNLSNLKVFTDNSTEELASLVLPTSLAINDFIDNFIPPEQINIWNLYGAINRMFKSGLPILRYQIYYYKQLFKPLMMCATVILAGCFFSLRSRDNSQVKMIIGGLILGFTVYSALEIISRILAFNGFVPMLAVLLPIFLMVLISNFVILHLHES